VDLLPGFSPYAARYVLFNDPSHFSPNGHLLAAQLLFDPVRKMLRGLKTVSKTHRQ
jgi:hypothetical protein